MSIEDVSPDQQYETSFQAIINSPRTLEACHRQGVELTELDPVTQEQIKHMICERDKKKKVPQVLIDIRMQHYDEKRKQKFTLIKEERQLIIEEAERGSKYMNNTVQNSHHKSSAPLQNSGQGTITDRKFISQGSAFQKGGYGNSMGQSLVQIYFQQTQMMSHSQGNMQSAMLDKEKKELEKIKFRQKKDIEQMMEYELKMEQIRERNEEKLKITMDKEEKRRMKVAQQQKEQEEKKRRDEEKKREKQEQELLEQKKRAEEVFKREQEMAEKLKLQEKQRKKEALKREEERRKKQEEFIQQTEKIMQEQQKQVDKRKQDLEKRDQERREFMLKKQAERQKFAQKKRYETEKKIEQAKTSAEEALTKQRKDFEIRQSKVEEKRKQFEVSRSRERSEIQKRAWLKSLEIQKVQEQNTILEEKRKDEIRQQQQRAEQRKQKLEHDKQKWLEDKKKYLEEKEKHSEEVRKQMEERENARIEKIKAIRNEKDQVMGRTQSQKEWDLMIKKELDLLKREDKQESVERISRAQGYKKQKIIEKIEFDNMKAQHVKKEKEKLLETRFQVRREADRQKKQVMDNFEAMKKKGKIDNSSLQKLGIDSQIQEDPAAENEHGQDNEQSKELEKVIEEEKKAEQEREKKIAEAKGEEKKKLISENEAAKARSAEKIAKMKQQA